MKYIDQYINGLGDDGGCDEGPGYWFGASGAVFDGLNLIDNATAGKISIYKEPFIKKMASYIYKTHISGDHFINVADAEPGMRPNGVMLYRFGKAISDTQMMTFGSWVFHNLPSNAGAPGTYNRSRSLFNMAAIKECAAYADHFQDVADVWFSDVQLMASRAKNGFFVASHAGHNGESHNHNDVGDFMIYFNNNPLIVDVGPGAYTARTFTEDRYKLWFNSSAYHNLPVINGYQQAEGVSHTALDVHYQSNDNLSSLRMNIASAYPAESGVKSWIREISLNKEGSVDIIDSYKLEKLSDSLTQSFMTVCPTEIQVPGKIAFNLPGEQKVFLDYDSEQWNVQKQKIDLVTEEDQRFKTMWQGKDIWRVVLRSKQKAKEGKVLYHIHQ